MYRDGHTALVDCAKEDAVATILPLKDETVFLEHDAHAADRDARHSYAATDTCTIPKRVVSGSGASSPFSAISSR